MKKAIYSFIYYRLLGWKTNVTVPNYDNAKVNEIIEAIGKLN